MSKGNFKQRAKNYKQVIKSSHDEGYDSGWNVYDKIPNTRGARAAAKVGFSKGLNRHHKANKYAARAKK